MGSIWKHAFHYVFGFILIVVIILLITSSEISMVLAYFQLSKYFIFTFRGDYRWWWKSYLVSGSVAIYIFAYSVYYYFNTLQMTRFSSFVLYFSYMFLGSAIAFLVTGSIGFVSTYFFLRKIYSMIKID
jgi:transmembrane 9 superfamily protein 2/4